MSLGNDENDSLPSLNFNFRQERKKPAQILPQRRKFSGPETTRRKSQVGNLPKELRRHSMMPMRQPRLSIDFSMLSERRRSTIRNSIYGPTTFSGLPLFFSEEYRKQPEMENTYKMEPDTEHKFKPHLVKEIIEKVLENNIDLNTETLVEPMEIVNFSSAKQRQQPIVQVPQSKEVKAKADHKERGELTTRLIEEVKEEVKGLNFRRHKIVVNAIVGEKKGQGVRVASRCLWNSDTDNFVCVQKEGKYCFIIVTVHGVYFE